jgi:L-carnitine CoA-transferase
MPGKTLVSENFGPLQGVKIVSTGTLIAQPFAAELAAEMGAEVIQIERPVVGDLAWRNIGIRLATKDGSPPVATTWIQERRNVFCVTLDLSKPRGREILLQLLARADIWMESSKPGTYSKWGLLDAVVWKTNPRLVITHVSGFGQSGDPDYVARPSYDVVGQAVGGMMYQTGFPDPTPPTRAAPWTGDYITALFTLWSSLAGLTYAREAGKGQAIDLAQYEAIHKTMGGTMIEYFQQGVVRERSGNRAQGFQPLDSFQAKDGWVVLGALGDVYDRLLPVIGLDSGDPKWQSACTNLESIEGIEFDATLRGWIGERSVAEVVHEMAQGKVPCSPIMSSKEMAEDPQYRAREMHIEWEDQQAGKVKGIGIAPKFSMTPGKIVRGAVGIGHDNQRVYGDLLGIAASELESLKRDKVI